MKKILIAAAVLAMTSAHAEELLFGDVNFFVPESRFILTGEAAYAGSQRTVGGVNEENENFDFNGLVNYGITDTVNVFAGLNYNFKNELDRGAGKNASNDGFENPVVGANFRLLNQNDGGMNFDIGLVASLAVEEAERGEAVPGFQTAINGNSAGARNALELNASVGRKWDSANEYRITAGSVFNMSGSYEQNRVASDNVTIDQDSSVDLFLAATYQYRPVREFMMSLAGVATRVGEFDQEDEFVITTENEEHIDFDLRFQAKYLMSDTFITRVFIGQGVNPDYEQTRAGVTTDIERRREGIYGLGFDFLF